jgi:hypothetical protein
MNTLAVGDELFDEAARRVSVKQNADPNATIDQVTVTFFTHNDDKDGDTSISTWVENPYNIFLVQEIAKLVDFAGNEGFGDNPPSTHSFELVISTEVALKDLTIPTYKIQIAPTGHDRWIFDVTYTLHAADGSTYSSTDFGIILDQDNRVRTGTFHG